MTRRSPSGWLVPLVVTVASVATVRLLRGGPIPAVTDRGPWRGGAPWPPVEQPTAIDGRHAPSSTESDVPTDAAVTGDLEPTSAGDTVALPTGDPWVDPVDGACPTGFPVKAKLSSGIFHVPGGLSYERTRPDRCYADADAAIADGLRAAKR